MRALLLAIIAAFAVAGCDQLDQVLYPRNEESTRDNLADLRDRIGTYEPGNGGKPPLKLSDAITEIPAAETGRHFRNDQVINACTDGKDASQLQDTGGWAYCGVPDNPNFGTLVVDCTHNDSTGKPWYSY